MRILVACESSGRVRDALIALGHDAISCDLVESEAPGPHVIGDVRPMLRQKWDMVISFPPCTRLCASGARWWAGREGEQRAALEFVLACADANAPRTAVENPIGALSRMWRKPDQIIQPWQFGHGETKATCLWTRGLPPLSPTLVVEGREQRVHRMPPSPNRARNRSRTYSGIAAAMAAQWACAAIGTVVPKLTE